MADPGATAASKDGAPDPLLGRVIGDKFKVLSLIARGGMGRVYRAEQLPLGRVCAVKVLNANYTGEHDPEFHKRFFLEASLTSKLRHPNTVTIFDYGQTGDGIYYMSMEYLEGYTLHRAIRQVGFLPEERAAHIARQVCRSLREAHSVGVVHRDLKPANVYLVEHGDEPDFVKVLDFGLVKDISKTGGEDITHHGLFMGSPKYMAPEQANGGPIDARTDIYALGIIMYEMVTGKVPFDRPKSLETLMAHQNEPPPPIRAMNPAARVSAALEDVIFRCIAKAPNDRLRSMDEVLSALKRLGHAAAPDPGASLAGDRPSLTPSGPQASRIMRGTGAGFVVPPLGPTGFEVPAAPAAPATDDEALHTRPPWLPQRRSHLRILAVVLGVLALAVGLSYSKLHEVSSAEKGVSPRGAGASASAGAGAAAAAVSAKPADAPPPEVGFLTLSPEPPASSKSAQVPAAQKLKGGAGPKPPATATVQAKPTSDCTPSYYYDADGNKHFKPECFAH